MRVEQRAYEIEEIWDERWFGRQERERIESLYSLLPHEGHSLLDVGCGNGLFLHYVDRMSHGRFERLCGIDRSSAALEHVTTEKMQACIESLPVQDQEFDIVSCIEVLEHLPVDIYERALREVARASRRYVLLATPYRQDLRASLCECPCCLTKFNPDYHMRSYDEETLRGLLLPYGFAPTGMHYLGRLRSPVLVGTYSWVRRFVLSPQAALRGQRAAQFPKYTICPVCNYNENRELGAALESAAINAPRNWRSAAKRLAKGMWPKRSHYRWIACVYSRGGV